MSSKESGSAKEEKKAKRPSLLRANDGPYKAGALGTNTTGWIGWTINNFHRFISQQPDDVATKEAHKLCAAVDAYLHKPAGSVVFKSWMGQGCAAIKDSLIASISAANPDRIRRYLQIGSHGYLPLKWASASAFHFQELWSSDMGQEAKEIKANTGRLFVTGVPLLPVVITPPAYESKVPTLEAQRAALTAGTATVAACFNRYSGIVYGPTIRLINQLRTIARARAQPATGILFKQNMYTRNMPVGSPVSDPAERKTDKWKNSAALSVVANCSEVFFYVVFGEKAAFNSAEFHKVVRQFCNVDSSPLTTAPLELFTITAKGTVHQAGRTLSGPKGKGKGKNKYNKKKKKGPIVWLQRYLKPQHEKRPTGAAGAASSSSSAAPVTNPFANSSSRPIHEHGGRGDRGRGGGRGRGRGGRGRGRGGSDSKQPTTVAAGTDGAPPASSVDVAPTSTNFDSSSPKRTYDDYYSGDPTFSGPESAPSPARAAAPYQAPPEPTAYSHEEDEF